MSTLATDAPLAVAVTEAIQTGDLAALRRVLREHPDLAAAHLGDEGEARTLLHVATDWPGHFPNGPAVVAALVEAGADVNAPFVGPHAETPLHWAASSDDVEVLDALVDAGADVEAPGAVLGGGTPLADAVGFGQWRAARRLLERGARTTLWQAAALGLLDRVEERFAGTDPPAPDEVTDDPRVPAGEAPAVPVPGDRVRAEHRPQPAHQRGEVGVGVGRRRRSAAGTAGCPCGCRA